ncbi:flagellar hook-length control protein FliK [Sphingobium sp.]|uniref:flagellar hook-length control protein FliK n=1 Tax=Sphingobium sp. TaxID=1912891 RepID=UPI0028BF59FC|nr:flagellar hook-length control protein FliK [Sphingobium sp.]
MSDVNMLTSLKALLFSSAAPAVPTEGAGVAAPVEGAVDFASLLSGRMDASAAADISGLPQAVEPTEETHGETAPDTIAIALPPGLATALHAAQGHRKASLPLSSGLVQRSDSPAPAVSADADQKPETEEETAASANGQPARPEGGMATMPIPALPDQLAISVGERPQAIRIAAKPVLHETQPLFAAPITGQPDEEAAIGQSDDHPAEDRSEEQLSSPIAPTPVPNGAPPMASAQPGVVPLPSQPVATATPQSTAAVKPALESTSPTPPAPQSATPDQSGQPAAPPADPTAASRVAGRSPDSIIPAPDDGALAADAPISTLSVTPDQPVKSEALALLQMVRDQLAVRHSGTPARPDEQVPGLARSKAERAAPSIEAAPPGQVQPLPADAAVQPLPPQPASGAVQPAAATAPVVDLSASLGAQVVDMGVSGQWIDGLARDIAGLSAHGAQGRFQINADQLGPVQVDIRQGADGAAVSLTVASEAAEMALRQDSDRLRLDAGLSAVRITDVKIERAPHVAESARADSAGQQSPQQQPSSQQPGQGAWANGQNMGQSQGQGRWQSRENSGFVPKNTADPAVLDHDDTRRAGHEALRARYA